MTKIAISFGAIAISLGVLLPAVAAQASTWPRTWVSHTGSDSNPCTAASAPCLTFGGAYTKTSVGGEIDVVDSGEFGAMLIDHAITIANQGAGMAATAGIAINAASTDAVILRGLTFNGVEGHSYGVELDFGGGSLLIDHCTIQGFTGGAGIFFQPNSAARLRVIDTVLSNNGTSSLANVAIIPVNGGGWSAEFERVQILNSASNGIRVDGTNGTGAITVELHDVTVDAAAGGSGIVAVSAPSGGAPVTIMATDVTAVNNAGYGLRAVGATATVFLRHSTSVNNGVGIGASGGGTMASFGDNTISGNSILDGNPTSVLSLK
jgi:hypothetical protein